MVRWGSDEETLIDAYLKHRGWREGPAGRRYLQALGESELKFWELTAVKPGAYVELRGYGTTGKSIRVKEKAASEYLHQWEGLAARVLPTGNGYTFSGAMLPLRPEVAGRVHSVLEGLPGNAQKMLQERVDRGELDTLPADMETLSAEMAASELPQIAFRIWAVETYMTDNKPSPELRNMNDEPITTALSAAGRTHVGPEWLFTFTGIRKKIRQFHLNGAWSVVQLLLVLALASLPCLVLAEICSPC